MFKQLRIAIVMFVALSVVTGIAYPALVTVLAQVAFPREANGSLIHRDRNIVGSELIGQHFDDPKYFWGRPSATNNFPNDASASSGSNLGPTNPAQLAAVQDRLAALRKANNNPQQDVPVELVTASASGLDPEISPAAAEFQVARVAQARGLPIEAVRALVQAHTQSRTLGVLGEPRVNVLQLNLALDTR